MEGVLDVSARPYEARHPALGIHAQPLRLFREARTPIAASRRHPRRVDDEYKRAGTASLSLYRPTPGAFYEAFEPEQARPSVRRLDLCRTPEHGSWLGSAGNALRALTRQGITGRRFAAVGLLRAATSAWQEHRHDQQRGVDWPFTVDDARVKRKSVYPTLQV